MYLRVGQEIVMKDTSRSASTLIQEVQRLIGESSRTCIIVAGGKDLVRLGLASNVNYGF